ncbi:MAG: 2-C-methyl-D-erythritol 4-phosphate cytidylyltransferase [Kiritimatiellia bacterium]
MNVAIIVAGGVGSRMGADVPKQFVQVNGKPVLLYTLEAFERHPLVDAIELVLIDGWAEVVEAYCERFGISKLKWIVPGGKSVQESIRNGVYALEDKLGPDDIVVIHDGVRPLVDAEVLDDVISKARQFGNGVSSLPYNEQIFLVDEQDPSTTTRHIPRETIRRVLTPQAYRFQSIDEAYRRAFAENVGLGASAYANTMMVELGHRLHFAAGSARNIKLTTPEDIAMFKGMLS